MRTYEKIETVFNRDINGSKKLIIGDWRNDTVKFLSKLDWLWTEKVDGTNIRIFWDGHSIFFAGRTDNAQIPTELNNYLIEKFYDTATEELFEQLFGEKEVILFGEGYGRKIQKVGSSYIPDGVDFILFDVLIGDNYQTRETVESVATTFDLSVVPVVGTGNLESAIEFVQSHPKSSIGDCFMEGIVCRPRFELRDRCNHRIIVKIKWEDFM